MGGGSTAATRTAVGGAALGLVSAIALYAVATAFLTWPSGQRIDETAYRGASIGQSHILESSLSLLHLVSGIGLVLATLAIAVVACLRRRVDLAAGAVVIVGGANVTTQFLKHFLLERPSLGIDTFTVNSLPSGHTTVAMSLAAALVMVAPHRLRGTLAVVGAAMTTLMGVATLAAGWHRPSDVVAAAFVVGTWAGAVVAVMAVRAASRSAATSALPRRTEPGSSPVPRDPRRDGRAAVALLGAGGLAALAVALLTMWSTSRLPAIPDDRSQLFVAYAGGAAGIAGTVSVLLAAVAALVASGSARGAMPARTSESSVSANVGGS